MTSFKTAEINRLISLMVWKSIPLLSSQWGNISPVTFHQDQYVFTRISSELYIKRVKPDLYQKIHKFDIPIEIKGKTVTPDMVLFSPNGSIEDIWEIKGSYHALSSDSMMSCTKRVQSKYTPETKVIFIVFDSSLPNKCNFNADESKLYHYMHQEIHSYIHLWKTPKWTTGFKHVPVTLLFKNLVEAGYSYDHPPAAIQTMDQLITETLGIIPKFEQFANNNSLLPINFDTLIKDPERVTVYSAADPWDRTAQRTLQEELKLPNPWGYRATNIHIIPFDEGYKIIKSDFDIFRSLVFEKYPGLLSMFTFLQTIGTKETNPTLQNIHRERHREHYKRN